MERIVGTIFSMEVLYILALVILLIVWAVHDPQEGMDDDIAVPDQYDRTAR